MRRVLDAGEVLEVQVRVDLGRADVRVAASEVRRSILPAALPHPG